MTDHAADHREIATSFLDATRIDVHGDYDRKVAIAQVHATLALAEEQRTANLIAMFVDGIGGGDKTGGLLDSIVARLGLTPTTPNQEQ